ncbi:MAG TPA: ANTAR domain-containing protein [Gaiellaceae bacterium]|jgi:AmiR/NasT family two-component response regulator|nr:ANTAR domain-containing protein [Gaiellaceae bacterium]
MNATRLRSPEQAIERQQAVSGPLELQEALRQENEQLRTALATRIVIEQTKGMLAERFEMDVDEAFERLRHQARSHRIKLHVLAAAVTAREAWAEAIVRPAEPRKPP